MPFYNVKGVGMVHVRFAKGKAPPHCRVCGDMATFLCDFPVAEGKTCDKSLCPEHAHEVAPDTHYCPPHRKEWEEFRARGGVERELGNVVPYKQDGGSR